MHFSVCDYLVDCLQNSVEADADHIELDLEQCPAEVRVEVRDNGRGMDEEELARCLDPFYSDGAKHPGRRVGLGIPFLNQALEAVGRRLNLRSEKGAGTEVAFAFDSTHVDAPPLGDVASALMQGMIFPGSYELSVRRSFTDADRRFAYGLSRTELSEALDGLDSAGSISLLKRYIESKEREITDYMDNKGEAEWRK